MRLPRFVGKLYLSQGSVKGLSRRTDLKNVSLSYKGSNEHRSSVQATEVDPNLKPAAFAGLSAGLKRVDTSCQLGFPHERRYLLPLQP